MHRLRAPFCSRVCRRTLWVRWSTALLRPFAWLNQSATGRERNRFGKQYHSRRVTRSVLARARRACCTHWRRILAIFRETRCEQMLRASSAPSQILEVQGSTLSSLLSMFNNRINEDGMHCDSSFRESGEGGSTSMVHPQPLTASRPESRSLSPILVAATNFRGQEPAAITTSAEGDESESHLSEQCTS